MKLYIDLYKKAELSYENEDFEKALEYFKKLNVLNPSNTNANYIACCYIGLKQFDKAQEMYQILKNTTHWEPVYYNLARVYMVKKQFDDAFLNLKEAVAINPTNDDCYFYLGVYYEKIREYEKAIENYNKAVQLSDVSEDISMYLNNIGFCYYKMRDYDKALHYCNLSLEKDMNNKDAIYNIKLITTLKEGEYDE